MATNIVILAAGVGSRLGRPHPKPLTPLSDGETILHRALRHLTSRFSRHSIHLVVGFKKEMIMEAAPDVGFIYNQDYGDTNTSKSLLKALTITGPGGVLWLNGDVVFDEAVLDDLLPHIAMDRSFVCVNTESVAEEEVKYTLDSDGYIAELSKVVASGALGEAVGINFISSGDRALLARRLDECDAQDYFERGLELAIAKDGMKVEALDISRHPVIEVDFAEDLARANETF
ncbi:NTP transferase domain-containing protein [Stackebrandtia nassauensis]|uniref:UDP-N-acetylglucosamine pyrophosphorylase related protein n=1 Tax=Stackebrandtia nassauensis (strain DSM 44728 / CIP 108903 / NRRL B-16338 / NBRC 102104 / LLR-40K-21) TaxID=446470 RepID=D3Q8Z3_STANL|nr:phosphocholine cytidylyltransferase family protein [Stackebrandtia nassauensis]ADD40602.1 UDP-N-acetylglucosamine pyrophosphorylase related protein [Stackebrandtia nassauensis DSM 44728]